MRKRSRLQERGERRGSTRTFARPPAAGQGTFSAAQKAFEALATAYARRDKPESECLAYLEAGADLAAVHWLHDTSQEAVRDRAGVSASLEFGAYSPAAEATADELYMPSSGIYTPPGGEAS